MKRLFIGLFALICSVGLLIPMQTDVAMAAPINLPMVVTNLKAVSVGTTSVKLTWDPVNTADGYIIYRQDSKKNYAYRYMVKGDRKTTYTDTTAETGEYNFYWVFPYREINGERIIGKVEKYAYAKAAPVAVTNLKAESIGTTSTKLTWSPVKDADGYVIYRKIGNEKFTYRYLVNSTSYTDTTAKTGEYNYYRVYPYKNVNGKLVLGASNDYVYSKPVPAAVTNLKAVNTGTTSVKLTWSSVKNADGYIIYRKIDDNKFEYRYLVNNTSYTDTTAKTGVYNYYRVYAYKNVNGKRILGTSKTYVYNKPMPSAVTNLKAVRNKNDGITVSWSKDPNVDGYMVYSKTEDETDFGFVDMITTNSYIDNYIYDYKIRFYRVVAYKVVNGDYLFSNSTNYVYSRAHDKPELIGYTHNGTVKNCTSVSFRVKNNGNKTITFLSKGAALTNDIYYWYRSLSMVNSKGYSIDSVSIKPGEEKTLYFDVIGSPTLYDNYSIIYTKFLYDGVEYSAQASSYYGNRFDY